MRIAPRVPFQAALLAAGFLLLVLISGVSVGFITQSRVAGAAISHTLEVTSAVSGLRTAIRRAESAQRGYLLTGEPGYRTMFDDARQSITRQLDRIETLSSDNPSQTRRLQAIRTSLEPQLDSLAEAITLKAGGRTEEALTLARSGSGLDLMEDAGASISAMADAERALLAERRARDERISDAILALTLTGASAIVVLAFASVVLVRRSTRAAAEARAALEEANLTLEEKVHARTSELEDANEELQRFAYIVGHDLRSPLVNIMGFTSELEMLRDDMLARLAAGAPDPEADAELKNDIDEALGFIKSSTAKMDRLINAILALSRAGRREFHAERVDLSELVATLTGALTHQVQEAGASLTIDPLPVIRSDRLALEQILSNLIDNAVKYLRPDVPGHIRVSAGEKKGFVILKIADNGRGIAEQDLGRIFELFRRAGVQDRPGEGIGLAHVRMLVRRIGGAIRVDSTPGSGTTFSLILPKSWTPDTPAPRAAGRAGESEQTSPA
ncbi:sensor histidine kinase [Segnochrobactraceae bacterium EtOH-i3]